jgi:CTP synthase
VSINEALKHAGAKLDSSIEINWFDSKEFEEDPKSIVVLDTQDGLIIPGGFGLTGVEGKIIAVKHARETGMPFLGICFGFQCAVVEFSRNVLDLKDAHSTELDPDTPHPVIDIIPEQEKILRDSHYGATMRLGAYPAILAEDSKIMEIYGRLGRVAEDGKVYERHRHRYEVNPEYVERIHEAGLRFVGRSPDNILMEFQELDDHPYFVGTQAHPEFLSRPLSPAPLFHGLIEAGKVKSADRKGGN